ncbi:antibiotic biosynthesis monooxygenase [Micromonospora rifamycinica]|uniref:putative quinol monooxygenase n=1 Tax=Micromonospora rifamycinica TaxID=291594 RepID=UPI0033F5272A
MIVIFSSMSINPARRPDLDAEMAEWLVATAQVRGGASIYKYMTDPADPSKVYVFQSWPDDNSFATWTQQPAFQELLEKFRLDESITDVEAVIFEGCTHTRGGPL